MASSAASDVGTVDSHIEENAFTISTPNTFPDYTFWTRDQCNRFVGYIVAHEPKQERKWWWSYGFRMVKADEQPRKYRCVCETCARSSRAREKFIFMASNSQSLVAHLLRSHNISVSWLFLDEGSC